MALKKFQTAFVIFILGFFFYLTPLWASDYAGYSMDGKLTVWNAEPRYTTPGIWVNGARIAYLPAYPEKITVPVPVGFFEVSFMYDGITPIDPIVEGQTNGIPGEDATIIFPLMELGTDIMLRTGDINVVVGGAQDITGLIFYSDDGEELQLPFFALRLPEGVELEMTMRGRGVFSISGPDAVIPGLLSDVENVVIKKGAIPQGWDFQLEDSSTWDYSFTFGDGYFLFRTPRSIKYMQLNSSQPMGAFAPAGNKAFAALSFSPNSSYVPKVLYFKPGGGLAAKGGTVYGPGASTSARAGDISDEFTDYSYFFCFDRKPLGVRTWLPEGTLFNPTINGRIVEIEYKPPTGRGGETFTDVIYIDLGDDIPEYTMGVTGWVIPD